MSESRPSSFASGPDLDGRRALVTGAGGGIGQAVIAGLAACGARVAALDLDEPAMAGLPADMNGKSGVTYTAACDVAEPGIGAAVDAAAQALGGVDLLVCAAGVVSEAALEDLPLAEWRRVVDVSLTGTFLTLQAAIPHLRASDHASVVALSSGWARRPYPRGAHYAAAKAGVEAVVRSAAAELGPDGIRVNAVAPGPVRTGMLDSLPDFDEQARAAASPLGRIAEPEDVAGVVVFLLSDLAAFVTGQVVPVNGGAAM